MALLVGDSYSTQEVTETVQSVAGQQATEVIAHLVITFDSKGRIKRMKFL